MKGELSNEFFFLRDNKACYSPLVVLVLHSHKSAVSKEGMLQILTRLLLLHIFAQYVSL